MQDGCLSPKSKVAALRTSKRMYFLQPKIIAAGIGAAGALAWIPMMYAVATDVMTPEYFVAITAGILLLLFLISKYLVEKIMSSIDRIPTKEWFDTLAETLENDRDQLKEHETRISRLEGRGGVQ